MRDGKWRGWERDGEGIWYWNCHIRAVRNVNFICLPSLLSHCTHCTHCIHTPHSLHTPHSRHLRHSSIPDILHTNQPLNIPHRKPPHMHICTYTHAHINMHIYTCTYTYAHIHMHIPRAHARQRPPAVRSSPSRCTRREQVDESPRRQAAPVASQAASPNAAAQVIRQATGSATGSAT